MYYENSTYRTAGEPAKYNYRQWERKDLESMPDLILKLANERQQFIDQTSARGGDPKRTRHV